MEKKPKPTKRNKWILFLLVLIATGLYSSSASAQYKRARNQGYGYATPPFYVGLEAVAGIRSYTIKSNIEQFNNVHLVDQGESLGFAFGGNTVMVKARHGSYKSSKKMEKEINMKETSFMINIFPLQFGQNGARSIEPYVVIGIDVNKISFSGAPLPKKVVPKLPKKECCCESPGDASSAGGPPPNPGSDPDALAVEEPITETSETGMVYIGTIKMVRASIGVGVQANIGRKRTFAKLFTEAKYGGSLNTTSTYYDLLQTKAKGQFSLNFGVIMGLNLTNLGSRISKYR